MNIFDQLNHIKKTNNLGDPAKMDGFVLWALDKIVGMSGLDVNIHCGYDLSGHADGSYHSKDDIGRAIDFHFVKLGTKHTIYEAYILVESILKALQIDDVVGLGVYVDWKEGTLGFHLDTRGTKMRWARQSGKYLYNKDFDNLIKTIKSW